MNICFVCNEYPPGPHGGIGTFTQVLGRALVKAGHEVRVIGHYSPNYPAPDYEEDQGVQVWRLRGPTSRGRWIWARYRLFQHVARWAKAGEIDLVEVPDYQGWAAFWPQLQVPVIARCHGSGIYFSHELGRRPSRRGLILDLERASLRRVDFWCAVSLHSAEINRKLIPLPPVSAVLYCPIDAQCDLVSKQRESNDVIFTGTLTPKKGVISLIHAWNQVVREFPGAVLHMYGKDGAFKGGAMRDHLRAMLNDQARDSVVFHGYVTREVLFQALQLAREAVFPSYSETFGIAPFEAMSCGCATIYTKRPPGPELVEDGVNALLVDPDNPDEIADAILRLLQDDALAQRLGEAGRKLVEEKYSVEAVLPQNIRFYEECIASFRAKRQG